ncbi:unnamed protein product [Amoebophrya sp. A120]|nr:unnamed protein product [Amoebophrya sp. A120]|eukprot:GSA120T00009148001.1
MPSSSSLTGRGCPSASSSTSSKPVLLRVPEPERPKRRRNTDEQAAVRYADPNSTSSPRSALSSSETRSQRRNEPRKHGKNEKKERKRKEERESNRNKERYENRGNFYDVEEREVGRVRKSRSKKPSSVVLSGSSDEGAWSTTTQPGRSNHRDDKKKKSKKERKHEHEDAPQLTTRLPTTEHNSRKSRAVSFDLPLTSSSGSDDGAGNSSVERDFRKLEENLEKKAGRSHQHKIRRGPRHGSDSRRDETDYCRPREKKDKEMKKHRHGKETKTSAGQKSRRREEYVEDSSFTYRRRRRHGQSDATTDSMQSGQDPNACGSNEFVEQRQERRRKEQPLRGSAILSREGGTNSQRKQAKSSRRVRFVADEEGDVDEVVEVRLSTSDMINLPAPTVPERAPGRCLPPDDTKVVETDVGPLPLVGRELSFSSSSSSSGGIVEGDEEQADERTMSPFPRPGTVQLVGVSQTSSNSGGKNTISTSNKKSLVGADHDCNSIDTKDHAPPTPSSAAKKETGSVRNAGATRSTNSDLFAPDAKDTTLPVVTSTTSTRASGTSALFDIHSASGSARSSARTSPVDDLENEHQTFITDTVDCGPKEQKEEVPDQTAAWYAEEEGGAGRGNRGTTAELTINIVECDRRLDAGASSAICCTSTTSKQIHQELQGLPQITSLLPGARRPWWEEEGGEHQGEEAAGRDSGNDAARRSSASSSESDTDTETSSSSLSSSEQHSFHDPGRDPLASPAALSSHGDHGRRHSKSGQNRAGGSNQVDASSSSARAAHGGRAIFTRRRRKSPLCGRLPHPDMHPGGFAPI